MAEIINNQTLAQGLISLVCEQQFERAADSMRQGKAVQDFPSIDLAVAVFPHNSSPLFANVLFSRDLPNGHVAKFAGQAGPVNNLHYQKDQLNANLDSIAWFPGADWKSMQWETLYGDTGPDFVEPYPASLLKVMVLIGVAKLVDEGKFSWEMTRSFDGVTKSIADWAESMIVASNNDATTVLVSLLHQGGLIVRRDRLETNHLHALFARYGLPTLKLANTQPNGNWRSAHGAGVGNIHMTAWDTVRLLWLINEEGDSVPWLPADTPPLLSQASRKRVWDFLRDQGLHTILSSTSLSGVVGWHAGIDARLPARWIQQDGSVVVEDSVFPADVRPVNNSATLTFAHKTGNTENYCSDAGLVSSITPGGRRYLIALLTNLGTRYQADPACSTTWRIPALGEKIDQFIASFFRQ